MNKRLKFITGCSMLLLSCGTEPTPWSASDVCPDAPGILHDERDGQDYKTVKIGTQTWMAQNLNYTMGNSFCYDGADSNCVKYGRLYDFPTADSACPAGWHLPSDSEWTILVDDMGGSGEAGQRLKSASGWVNDGRFDPNGSDDCGFSAMPGGGRGTNWGYDLVGYRGNWWVATQYNEYWAYKNLMSGYDEEVYKNSGSLSDEFYSVRCIHE